MTDENAAFLATLHRLLNQNFNLAEIQILCFFLNLDYESIPGEEKSSRIRELLLGLARNGRLHELISLVQQQRPHTSWPSVPADFQLPASLASNNPNKLTAQHNIYGDQIQSYHDRQITSSGQQNINVSGDLSAGRDIHVGNKYIVPVLVIILIIISFAGVIFLVSREGAQIAEESSSEKLPVFPETDFVVVVSEFQVNGNSRVDNPEAIADTFVNEIETIIDQNRDIGNNISFVSPTSLNTKIIGDTPEERASNAEMIAEDINADVIIYGVITWVDWKANVDLEFVVSNEFIELGEGEEIVEKPPDFSIEGPYFPSFNVQMIKGDNPEALDTARANFANGFKVLLEISSGLSHYTLGDYKLAEQKFQNALDMTQEIPDWHRSDVIYVLIGNAIGQQCAEMVFREELYELSSACFDRAIAIYDKAIEENSLYPRAYLGRGSALYMQGIGDPNNDSVNLNLLNQAIDDYQEALIGKEYIPQANIEAKANLGLGQSILAKTIANLNINKTNPSIEHFRDSQIKFEAVIHKCELEDCAGGVDFWLQELAAKAYGNLGLIYYLTQDFDQAALMYEKAINLLPTFTAGQKRLKSVYEGFLNEIEQQLDKQVELQS